MNGNERLDKIWRETLYVAPALAISNIASQVFLMNAFERTQESTYIVPEDRAFARADFRVNSDEVIPGESKSLLKSGKLSVKPMPKTKFYEYYQDYVCGCILRVARELFAALPLDLVVVTAHSDILTTSTGHVETQPILSALIPRETISSLNFDNLDPSDSMRTFVHNMKFLKTKGFQPVSEVQREEES